MRSVTGETEGDRNRKLGEGGFCCVAQSTRNGERRCYELVGGGWLRLVVCSVQCLSGQSIRLQLKRVARRGADDAMDNVESVEDGSIDVDEERERESEGV